MLKSIPQNSFHNQQLHIEELYFLLFTVENRQAVILIEHLNSFSSPTVVFFFKNVVNREKTATRYTSQLLIKLVKWFMQTFLEQYITALRAHAISNGSANYYH